MNRLDANAMGDVKSLVDGNAIFFKSQIPTGQMGFLCIYQRAIVIKKRNFNHNI